MATRFQINGEIYKAEELEGIKLIDTIVFDEQCYALHQAIPDFPVRRWLHVQEAMEEVQGLTEDEAAKHPRANFLLAATLWLTMRAAGKAMNFAEVVNIDIVKDIVWLPDTTDRAGGASDPTKQPAKSRASAAAGKGHKPAAK